jgi:predicted metallopeptidase
MLATVVPAFGVYNIFTVVNEETSVCVNVPKTVDDFALDYIVVNGVDVTEAITSAGNAGAIKLLS